MKFPDLHILCPTVSIFWYRKIFSLFTKTKLFIFQMDFAGWMLTAIVLPFLTQATWPQRKICFWNTYKVAFSRRKLYFLVDLNCILRDLFLRKKSSSKKIYAYIQSTLSFLIHRKKKNLYHSSLELFKKKKPQRRVLDSRQAMNRHEDSDP